MPPEKDASSTEPTLGVLRPLMPSPPTSPPESPSPRSSRLPSLATLNVEAPGVPTTGISTLPSIPSDERTLRILDFDIECRPLNYAGQDFTNAEVTAIACGWADSDHIECWSLAHDKTMLGALGLFKAFWQEADMVTGHFIRKFDLPVLNGSCLEHGVPPLTPKLTCDTYLDLIKRKDVSASQENLGRMLGLEAPKVGMSQVDWREANRLTPEGIAKTRERVIGDVRQHKQLRLALIKRGLLKPPKTWTP